ncbi:MAG TPA: glycoside hydrolase family 16 protein [Gammaproteobacteria bacterium]
MSYSQTSDHKSEITTVTAYATISLVFSLGITSCAIVEVASTQTLPPPPPGQSWAFVWGDEFDDDAIDQSKWTVQGDYVRRKGLWSREDAYLDGEGHLVLRTRRTPNGVSSGAVSSTGKFERRNGLYVIRCKFGDQPGHWPAFWLFTQSVQTVGDDGLDGTEIDIMEKPWIGDAIHHNLHWDGYGEAHRWDGTEVPTDGINDGFHTFAVHWTENEYIFYVDGRETWRSSSGGISRVPQAIWITDEVDDLVGSIDSAQLPDYFTVDWVRVYDAEDGEQPSQDQVY